MARINCLYFEGKRFGRKSRRKIMFQNKPSEFGNLIWRCKMYCTDGKGIVFALENSYGYGKALAA